MEKTFIGAPGLVVGYGAGGGGNSAAQPKRVTESDRMVERVRELAIHSSQLVNRLDRAVDRISGPVPTGVEVSGDSPAEITSNHVRAMDISLSEIERNLGRLRAEIERLEGFA